LEIVIILHDPFLSRAAVPEGSMVVSTAHTRGPGFFSDEVAPGNVYGRDSRAL